MNPLDPMNPNDPFTGLRMALSKCCNARIISCSLGTERWAECGKCHERTSSKPKTRQPHYCPYCPVCRYSKGALTQHINSEHWDEKTED